MTTPFLYLVKQMKPKKLMKRGTNRHDTHLLTIHTTTNDSLLSQLFGLWSSLSWLTVTMSKRAHSWSSTKPSAVVFPCAMLPSP